MKLIDGRLVRAHHLPLLLERVGKLSFKPTLTIIQVGKRSDSDAYIRAKKLFAAKIGAQEIHIELPEDASEDDIALVIEKYNKDTSVQGIILQLPLPPHLNSKVLIDLIDPNKDIDGHKGIYTPATARGVGELCDFYNIDFKGKKVTMMGSSDLVGKPLARMAEEKGAIVTLCNRKTDNVPEKAHGADILIVAIGQPHFVGPSYVHKDQIVIDVGITRLENDILVGDVDFEKVKDHVAMITPVPGGVGQMTVLALFENLVDACYSTQTSIIK